MNAWFVGPVLIIFLTLFSLFEYLVFELWEYVKGYSDYKNTKNLNTDLNVLYLIHLISAIIIGGYIILYVVSLDTVAWIGNIVKFVLVLTYIISIAMIWNIGALFTLFIRRNNKKNSS